MNLLRRVRWGYLAVVVPALSDWIDTGHVPHHPRELVTEVAVGLLLGVLVWALYREADRYRALSETDPLTGLPNRRRFEDELAREVRRAGDSPLAVAFADVDAFKEINDTRGHDAGDEVLRGVARALRGALRRGDGAYRVGGDEFAVILPGATAEDAKRALAEALGPGKGGVLQESGVTLSVGIEELRPRESARALLRRADAAMYSVKGSRKEMAAGAKGGPAAARRNP